MGIAEHLPRGVDDVIVRQLAHRDAEPFALGTTDQAVRQYAHLPLTDYTPEIVREQIDGVILEGLHSNSLAVLAIADAASDQFLGSIVLFDFRDDRAEVGFWLAPSARGRAAAVRALAAITQVAAESGLSRLEARTVPDNAASRRVLEAAGFARVGQPYEGVAPSGATVTVLAYERLLY